MIDHRLNSICELNSEQWISRIKPAQVWVINRRLSLSLDRNGALKDDGPEDDSERGGHSVHDLPLHAAVFARHTFSQTHQKEPQLRPCSWWVLFWSERSNIWTHTWFLSRWKLAFPKLPVRTKHTEWAEVLGSGWEQHISMLLEVIQLIRRWEKNCTWTR